MAKAFGGPFRISLRGRHKIQNTNGRDQGKSRLKQDAPTSIGHAELRATNMNRKRRHRETEKTMRIVCFSPTAWLFYAPAKGPTSRVLGPVTRVAANA